MKSFLCVCFLCSLFLLSCEREYCDAVLKQDSIILPCSNSFSCKITSAMMPDYKSIEFISDSKANELNFFVAKVPIPSFYDQDEGNFDDLITKDVVKSYQLEASKRNGVKEYLFQYNRSKDDSQKRYVFVLYIEDTTLGILSASSSNVTYKIVAHK